MIQQVPQESSDLGDMPTPTRGDDGNVLTYDRQARAYVLKPPPKGTSRRGVLSYIAGNPGPTRLRDLEDVSGTPSGATDGYAYLYDSALDTFILGEVSTSSTIVGAEDFGGTPGPGTDGYALTWDNSAGEFVLSEMPSGGTPGGSDTHVQYNDGGSALGGDEDFTYDGSGTATLSTALVVPVVKPPVDSTAALRFYDAAESNEVLRLDTSNLRVGINGAANAGATLTVNQQAANKGIRVYGFGLSDFLAFSVNAGGAGAFSSSANMTFASGGITTFSTTTDGDMYIQGSGGANDRTVYIDNSSHMVHVGSNTSPSAVLDVAASTTSRASLRVRSGTAPTSPNDGDIWYASSGRAHLYRGSTSEIFATGEQQAGGSATAGASYTSTEQDMLQAVYDAAREFGLLD